MSKKRKTSLLRGSTIPPPGLPGGQPYGGGGAGPVAIRAVNNGTVIIKDLKIRNCSVGILGIGDGQTLEAENIEVTGTPIAADILGKTSIKARRFRHDP